MKFDIKLKEAMKELNLNQTQVVMLTNRSKSSISQYLSGKQTPTEKARRNIALALGLPEEYFESEEEQAVIRLKKKEGAAVKRLLPEDAARLLNLNLETVRKGLQQGVFPWGYAIKTSSRWTYFINAKRFAEVEGIAL